MNIEALEQRYQLLFSDFQSGRINAAAFAGEVDKLSFQDGWGRYWMIGAQSGHWYYYDGQGWYPADPRQLEPPPAVASVSPPQAGPQRRPPEILSPTTLLMAPVKLMGLIGLAFLVILTLLTWPVNSAPPQGGPLVAPSPRPPVVPVDPGGNGDSDGGDSDGSSSGPHSAIFGSIVDLSTDRPGAGIEVAVNGAIVRSDTEGNYSITGLSGGDYEVVLALQGEGVPAHGPVFVKLDGRNPTNVDLAYYTQAPPPPTDTPQPPGVILAGPPPNLPDSGAPRSSSIPLVITVLGLLLAMAGGFIYKQSSRTI